MKTRIKAGRRKKTAVQPAVKTWGKAKMIIRKSADNARLLRFGCSGDAMKSRLEAINTLLYALPTDLKKAFYLRPAQISQACPRCHACKRSCLSRFCFP